MKHIRLAFLLFTVFALTLMACGQAAPATEVPTVTEAPAITEAPAVALKVTGDVASDQAWTEDEVKAMPTMDAESVNNKGEKSTYTGVSINDLLVAAKPNTDATTVVFTAGDGTTAEVSLEELNACTDCIISFRNQGGFSVVMPGFPGDLQVKGVVEIQVK